VIGLKEVKINTDIIKLDQFLKWSGVAESGAAAKQMILSGIVKVNDDKAFQRSKKLRKGDKISIDGIGEFLVV
jgi:ribosome-associated protein